MTSDPVERYLSRSRRLQHRNVLRPMAGGELLDETIAMYRQVGAKLIIPMLGPAVVMAASQTFVLEYVLQRFFETQNQDSVAVQMGEFVTNAALGLFVAAPVWIIALCYAAALSVRQAGWSVAGQSGTAGEAARDAKRALPGMIWAAGGIMLLSVAGFLVSGGLMLFGALLEKATSDSSALAGLVAGAGVLGLFVGLGWFFIVAGRFGMVAPVAVLEGLRGRVLTQRAVELIKGEGRRAGGAGSVVSLQLTSAVIYLILSGTMTMVLDALEIPESVRQGVGGMLGEILAGALNLLPGVVALTLVLPFFTIAITVLYFERRVRVEGYDITALADDIDPGRRLGGVA